MHKMNLNNLNLSRMGFPAESFTKRQITLMHMASAFCNGNELLSESLENIKKTPESLNTFIKAFEYYDIPDEIREKVDTKINKIYRSNIQSIEQLKKDITTEVEEVLNVYSDSIENLLNQINSNLNKTFTNSAKGIMSQEPGSEDSNKLNFKEYKDTVFQDLCSDLQMLATEPKEKDKFYYLIDEINISLNQAYETGFNKNLSMTANVENFQKKLRDGLNEVFKDYQSKINDLKDRTNDNLQKVFQNTDFSYRNESTIKRVKETINPPLRDIISSALAEVFNVQNLFYLDQAESKIKESTLNQIADPKQTAHNIISNEHKRGAAENLINSSILDAHTVSSYKTETDHSNHLFSKLGLKSLKLKLEEILDENLFQQYQEKNRNASKNYFSQINIKTTHKQKNSGVKILK